MLHYGILILNLLIIGDLFSSDAMMHDYNPLIDAVEQDDIITCSTLLSSGHSPRCVNDNGDNPLVLATRRQNKELCALLLAYDRGLINLRSATYQPPVRIALIHRNYELCSLFLEHGARHDYCMSQMSCSPTCMRSQDEFANDPDIAALFIKYGARLPVDIRLIGNEVSCDIPPPYSYMHSKFNYIVLPGHGLLKYMFAVLQGCEPALWGRFNQAEKNVLLRYAVSQYGHTASKYSASDTGKKIIQELLVLGASPLAVCSGVHPYAAMTVRLAQHLRTYSKLTCSSIYDPIITLLSTSIEKRLEKLLIPDLSVDAVQIPLDIVELLIKKYGAYELLLCFKRKPG